MAGAGAPKDPTFTFDWDRRVEVSGEGFESEFVIDNAELQLFLRRCWRGTGRVLTRIGPGTAETIVAIDSYLESHGRDPGLKPATLAGKIANRAANADASARLRDDSTLWDVCEALLTHWQQLECHEDEPAEALLPGGVTFLVHWDRQVHVMDGDASGVFTIDHEDWLPFLQACWRRARGLPGRRRLSRISPHTIKLVLAVENYVHERGRDLQQEPGRLAHAIAAYAAKVGISARLTADGPLRTVCEALVVRWSNRERSGAELLRPVDRTAAAKSP
jgi:hypothetical protein